MRLRLFFAYEMEELAELPIPEQLPNANKNMGES
jgi:hypothetical protein